MAHPVTRIDFEDINSVRRTVMNVLRRCPEAERLSPEMLEEIADMVISRNFHSGSLASYAAIVSATHAELE